MFSSPIWPTLWFVGFVGFGVLVAVEGVGVISVLIVINSALIVATTASHVAKPPPISEDDRRVLRRWLLSLGLSSALLLAAAVPVGVAIAVERGIIIGTVGLATTSVGVYFAHRARLLPRNLRGSREGDTDR